MFAGSWQGDEPICGEVVTGFDRIYFLRSGTELLEFSTRPRSLMDDSPTGQSKDPRHGG
jgi:hypothetical protein